MNRRLYLYVDDDPLSREVMKMMVEMVLPAGDLVLFDDSADFMPRVLALPRPPDVVLLDIHVTPYDGFDMLTMLRSLPSWAGKPIVALTASVMNEDIARLHAAGFDGAIAKPLSVHTFPGLIERIIARESVWHIA